jgi:ectoine hydroxylase-related dioxygenase (phytanoyl-CoA dioxygenase family)
MTQPLTADEIRRWHEEGYLVRDRFADGQTLSRLREAYDDVLERRTVAEGDRFLGELTRQVMTPRTVDPYFADNPLIDQARAIATRLLGAQEVALGFEMLIYKPPGHPHETPWHQDLAYVEMPFAGAGMPIPQDWIQFWVPLDDVDLETGCMQFVPGCHDAHLLEHRVASGDPTDEGRLLALVDPEAQLDLATAEAAEIPAGGVTLHGPGTPHRTGPNRSATRHRRADIFNLGSTARAAASR